METISLWSYPSALQWDFLYGNSFIHIFVHLFSKYNGFLASATILDLQDTVMKKTNKVTALKELESSWKASLLNVLGLLLGSDIELFFFFFKNGKDPTIMDLVQEHSRS